MENYWRRQLRCALLQPLPHAGFSSHLQLLPLQSLEIFPGPEAQGCGISTEPSPQTKIQLLHSQIPALNSCKWDVCPGVCAVVWGDPMAKKKKKEKVKESYIYRKKKIIKFYDSILKTWDFMQCFRLTIKVLLNWKYLKHLQHQITQKTSEWEIWCVEFDPRSVKFTRNG